MAPTDHAALARGLAAQALSGTLSTLTLDAPGPGFPYGSIAPFALDGARPILLLSELAEHTRNLRADPRASLLVVEPGEGDPLARARACLLGRCLPADDERDRLRALYLAAHPEAARFVDFRDFHFFALTVEAARFVAGFGRMSWIDRAAWEAAG